MERPRVTETTAWGAASLAGLAVGFWDRSTSSPRSGRVDRRFEPAMPAPRRTALLAGWHRAVERSKGWAARLSTGRGASCTA